MPEQFVCTECGVAFEAGFSGWGSRDIDPTDPVCEYCDHGWCSTCGIYRGYGSDGYPNCACS